MSTTSIVTVYVTPSTTAIRDRAAATGQIIDGDSWPIDLRPLTPDQRKLILAHQDMRYSFPVSVIPDTAENLMTVIAEYDVWRADKKAVEARAAASAAVENAERKARQAAAEDAERERTAAGLARLESLSDAQLLDCNVGVRPYGCTAEYRERFDAIELRQARLRDARSAAVEAERLAWIEAHGSEYLRTAVGAGYNCQRTYVIERAALELPDFGVDYKDEHKWRSRSCPSEAALTASLALQAGGQPTATVVWMTPASAYGDGDYYDSEAGEAIRITGYLGRYTLYSHR